MIPQGHLVAAAVAIALLIGAYAQGFSAGVDEVTAEILDRDNQALREREARIRELEAERDAKEGKHANDLAGISGRYQKELSDARVRNALLDADVAAGRVRLHVALAGDAGSRGQSPAACAGPERRDGHARADVPPATAGALSAADSAFLIAFAREADDVVRQLSAAQQVILADREVCK